MARRRRRRLDILPVLKNGYHQAMSTARERSTRQRAAIEAALRAAGRPLSPEELHGAARRMVPGLGIATVYRTLKDLAAAGDAQAVALPGGGARWEPAGLGHHHHFRCRSCDRLYEVHGCPGDLAHLAPRGFRVEGHDLTLHGLCAACGA